MYDLPSFENALASFRRFLNESGHPTEVFWVFRDDVWKRSKDLLISYRSASQNLVLAQKVFAEGRERGLVDIHAE